MDKTLQLTNIYNNVQKAKAFQNKLGLLHKIHKFNDFYNGKQWSEVTEKTKNFPRPVYNITKMIIENKASAISGSPIQIKFTTQVEDDRSRQFNDFAQHILKKMDFQNLIYSATHRCLIDGTSVIHFYWDETMEGENGEYVGGLNAEVLDICNVYFSDPQESDIQRQRWIVLETRLPVDYVRSICENKKDAELIQSDYKEATYPDDYNEIDDDSLVTTYIEYTRNNDGEVKVKKATKNVVIHNDKYLNPRLDDDEEESVDELAKEDDLQLDKENIDEESVADTQPLARDGDSKLEKKSKKKPKRRFSRYPLSIMVFSPIKDSIYGRSEVEDLVNVQREINASSALSYLTLQNSGSPKIVAKKGALKGQEITNEVGEVLIDHTPIGSQGLYVLAQNPSVAGALELAPNMFNFIRTITNTNDIMTGDQINSNVSGTAIAQAQSQAKARIKLQENQLFKMVKESVRVIEQFQRLYYVEEQYSYRAKINDKLMALGNNMPIPNYYKASFTSADYDDLDVSADLEVGYGTQYSETLEIDMLNNLLANQFIDFDTFVELAPNSIMPFKSQLKEKIAMKQQSELEQLKVENNQLKKQQEEMSIYSKQQEKAIKDLTSELERETSKREKLQREAESQISELSQKNNNLNNDLINIISAIRDRDMKQKQKGDNTNK